MRWESTRGIRGVPQRNDRDKAELLLDELRREDELFTSRLNLFLVAESLLFLSYATFLGVLNLNNLIIYEINLLGICITFIYAVVINRSAIYIDEIRGKLTDIYPNYKELKDEREGKGNVNNWFRSLPIVFIIAWIMLFFIKLIIYDWKF